MTRLSRTMSLLPHLKDNIFLVLNFTLEQHNNHKGGIRDQRASYSCASVIQQNMNCNIAFHAEPERRVYQYSSAFYIGLPVISSLNL